MKVGIIGCGFIGNEIADFIDKNKGFKLIALNDIDVNKVNGLIKKLRNNKPKFMGLNDLIRKSDLIVESAAKSTVGKILSNKNLDKKDKKLLIMSTGGLISNLHLLNKIKNCQIYLPSGAIAGLDAIKSVSKEIASLTLTTTKSPKSLEGAPFIIERGIDLRNFKNKKIIFEGNLKDAINGFPQNVNVAATLFLASKFRNIKVRVIADPSARFNTHEILAAGRFGRVQITTNSLPSKNPRTSYLAVLSAINILESLGSSIKIGN